MHRRHQVSFALSLPARCELERHLGHGINVSSGQNLEQELETGGLKIDAGDAFPPQHKVAGHRVLYFECGLLYWFTGQQAHAGNGGSEGTPSIDAMGHYVTASNGEVAAVYDFADKGWQQFGGMLQVGVNDAQ